MGKNMRVVELVQELNKYRDAYYNRNESLVSDKEYDDLFDELQKLEEETGIVMSTSPTQNVGYEVKSELTKVKHSHSMLSLDKTKDVNELVKFAGNQDCILSCKMDGLTILLTYEDGKLIRAETRGNGEEGEDVTHNAKVFENIPLTIPNHHHIEIEGEAIITYEDFEKINATLPEDKKYKNPRNLVSGSVRQLDSSIAKDRHIKFVAWKLPKGFMQFGQGLEFIKSLGFEVVPYLYTDNDIKVIENHINELQSIATEFSYPIDGLVMTYDSIEYGKSLGMTGHHPKHSIAYKFYDEEVETKLIDIEWTMGKTGVLTPTAVFEPVEIDGTSVERASVHNVSILTDLDLHIGDTISVYKANMIIPQIKENVSARYRRRPEYIPIPPKCPMCGGDTKLDRENSTINLVCTNPNCKGKLLGKLSHFVSKSAMNIDGLSDATLQFLIDKKLITVYDSPYDEHLGELNKQSDYSLWSFISLYDLKDMEYHINEWKHSDGFGEKSVDKIIDAIDKSRTTTLDKFINSLSIPMVGKETSKLIAKNCKYDIEEFRLRLQTGRYYYWNTIDGIGDIVCDNINNYILSNRVNINDLSRRLYFIKPNDNNNSSVDYLSGKVFVITGSVNKFKNRDELKNKIEELGGKVTGSVSAKTNFLINNDSASNSSKNKKAKELGVKIITEDEFINMITNN